VACEFNTESAWFGLRIQERTATSRGDDATTKGKGTNRDRNVRVQIWAVPNSPRRENRMAGNESVGVKLAIGIGKRRDEHAKAKSARRGAADD
jgi:hypothetical protein